VAGDCAGATVALSFLVASSFGASILPGSALLVSVLMGSEIGTVATSAGFVSVAFSVTFAASGADGVSSLKSLG